MKFSIFQVSRKGGRGNNEDRMGYCYTRGSGLFLLADGMGGHPEGEVAAQLALQTISAMYQNEAHPGISDIPAFLSSALMAAHRQILRYGMGKGMSDTPRTTLVIAIVQDGSITWLHCGDSRMYLVRGGDLMVRTRDHSYIEQSQGAGTQLSEDINRNILFTCLGSPTKPVFDIGGPVSLQQHDKILLCSDGLWSSVTDAEIVYHLEHKPVADAAPDLVEMALRKAGDTSDNVTVVALEWETPDDSDSVQGSISTDTIRDGVFASTVQAGGLDPMEVDLDDEAIERSIAEINEAIKRSAAKRA